MTTKPKDPKDPKESSASENLDTGNPTAPNPGRVVTTSTLIADVEPYKR
jgi:hypothetical protein